MAGGKGGSSTSTVEIPEYIEKAAQRNLNKAERISQLGYVPQYGPDVAAFTPMQQAAFQNTADTAGAFGMAAPATQQNIMGGMDAPTTYAGGVQGYSSQPIFQQSLDAFRQARPAQADYIDSFFIDPTSGQYAYQPTDYTQFDTAAQAARNEAALDRANDLAVAEASANTQNTVLTPAETQQYAQTVAGPNYNPATDILTPEQVEVVTSNTQQGTDARVAQEDLAMGILGNANNNLADNLGNLTNNEASFDNPSSSGSYGGSLTTGNLSGNLTGIPGVVGNIADNAYAGLDFEGAVDAQGKQFAENMGSTLNDDGTYDISSWFDPTVAPVEVAPVTPAVEVTPLEAAPTASGAEASAEVTDMGTSFYDGSFEKGKAVADILSSEYGWSAQQLAEQGYEGYAADAPTFAEPSETGSYGGSLATGGLSGVDGGTGDFSADVATQGAQFAETMGSTQKADGTYDISSWYGGGDGGPDGGQTGGTAGMSGATQSGAMGDGLRGGDPDGPSGDGCVVATHAVESGAFTPHMKREAVVWCMSALHGKWWGEAVRRGYRHLGTKKIRQGKAREHYGEFRRYVDFASGKRRTLRGAITFTLRTAQFFAVGLVKKDA